VPVGADNWFVEWAGIRVTPGPLRTSIEELLWSRNLLAGNRFWEICEDRYHALNHIDHTTAGLTLARTDRWSHSRGWHSRSTRPQRSPDWWFRYSDLAQFGGL